MTLLQRVGFRPALSFGGAAERPSGEATALSVGAGRNAASMCCFDVFGTGLPSYNMIGDRRWGVRLKPAPRLDRTMRDSVPLGRATNLRSFGSTAIAAPIQNGHSFRTGHGPPRAVAAAAFGVPELPTPFVPRERLMQQLDTAILDPLVL